MAQPAVRPDPADVAAAFGEYVAAHTPDGIEATVRTEPGVRPCHSPIDESVDTSLLLRGAQASAYLWPELAAADLR